MAGTGRLSELTARLLGDALRHVPSGRCAVAVSGGADSALAAWLAVEANAAGDVVAIHVHHGQPASDDLAGAARAVADSLGIDLRRVDIEVPAGASFEGRAREVRLSSIERLADDVDWIITGHHADDSAETTLANMFRGAGATGLAGIAPVRDKWVRPLLPFRRRDLRSAAEELGLPFADDPSNEDPGHRRNVMRREVLPWLEERLELPVAAVIGRSARLLAADDMELQRAADSVSISVGYGAVSVPAVVLTVLPPAVATRVVRRLVRTAHPPYAGTAADVESVLEVASGGPPRMLSGSLHVEREGPMVTVFEREPAPLDPRPIQLGSSTDARWWRLSACVNTGRLPPLIGRTRVAASVPALEGELIVRSAATGERIDLGGGSKAVREAMREGGIPRRLRSAWPILAVDGKIAWVAGARLADWARPQPGSDPVAVLKIEGTG